MNLIIYLMDNDNKPKYNMLRKLGEGTYGKAYLVEYSKDKVSKYYNNRIYML